MGARIEGWIHDTWYGDSPYGLLLLPFAWLYRAVTVCRRRLYSSGVFRTHRLSVPVIVIGNITAGGTGKTPLTVWLAQQLGESGLAPAIVSRGYRGKVGPVPLRVTVDSDPAIVGDEAVLMARHCDCPVIVHPDRVAAARLAIELGANVVVSDDGLQHYRLSRDFEIVVVDGERLFGNRRLLPAGPLREPLSRLDTIDQIVVQCEGGDEVKLALRKSDLSPVNFRLQISAICRPDDSDIRSSADFAGAIVHALAGIGNPGRFFRLLEAHGIEVIPHPVGDHAPISARQLDFGDGRDVLMTEKDAVRIRWSGARNCWYVPVDVVIDDADTEQLMNRICHRMEAKPMQQ